jgi:hypothetical protein
MLYVWLTDLHITVVSSAVAITVRVLQWHA